MRLAWKISRIETDLSIKAEQAKTPASFGIKMNWGDKAIMSFPLYLFVSQDYLASLIVAAVTTPHTQLKNKTTAGV
jgi:hypothetical protein